MFPSRRIVTSGGASSFRDDHSLAFDGSNDYVSIGGTFESLWQADFSVSIWAKPADGRPAGVDALLGCKNSSGEDFILFYISPTGQISFTHTSDNSNSGTATTLSATTTLVDGPSGWHHFVFAVKKSTATTGMQFYLDGQLTDSVGTDGIGSTDWGNFAITDNVHIGAYNVNGTATSHFEGSISDIAMYDRVLTSNEVATIYNNREPFNHKDWLGTSDLVAWWRFGDGRLDRWGSNPDANFNSFLITDEVSPTIGSDVIVNGTFASDSGWSKGGGWSISGGTATRAAGESSNSAIEHSADVISADKTYKYSFDYTVSSGNCSVYLGGTTLDSSFTGSGTNSGYATAIGGGEFTLYGLTNAEVTSIDNVQAFEAGGAAGTTVNMASDDVVGDTP